ncbi:MAG: hypothetical protein AAF329_20785, partial [Cyanobacteria bacterium P01_A01_bin.17]
MASKLPKNRRAGQREIERVVEKALKQIDRDEDNREAVDAMFDVIIHQLVRNRGLEAEQVAAKTNAVAQNTHETTANPAHHLSQQLFAFCHQMFR